MVLKIYLQTLLLMLFFGMACTSFQDQSKEIIMNDISSSGKIVYEYVVVEVPESLINDQFMYSHLLGLKIAETNVPKETVVYFDGEKSRQEGNRYEYGSYKSNAITITSSSPDSLTIYCKSFPHFDFWVKYEPAVFAYEEDRDYPLIEELKETKTIAGYLCKKAKIIEGYGEYYVYYTDSIYIDDPTGVVLSVDKIKGVIMEKEEIPTKFGGNTYLRTTVREVVFEPLPDNIFEVPEGFQYFKSIDEARAEDRRLWEKASENEWKENPLTEEEKNKFVGNWLMTTDQDSILIKITYTGSEAAWENSYRFTTITLTNKNESMNKVQEEEAHLQGSALMVDESPNYRLYDYDEEKEIIAFRWNELFTYQRILDQEASSLMKKYGLD